jgi:hypothetical protein
VEDWTAVAEFVGGGRNRAQCAQRWNRGLNPRIDRDSWKAEDEARLISILRDYRTVGWPAVARQMGDRSDVQCRYHFLQMCGDLRLPIDLFQLWQYRDRLPLCARFQLPFWASSTFFHRVKEGFEKALQAGKRPFTEEQQKEEANRREMANLPGDFLLPEPPVEDLFSPNETDWLVHRGIPQTAV